MLNIQYNRESVKEYVPPGLFHDLDPLYVESLIMERYKKHRGKSETEGIKEYIDLAQRTTCFGASIFKESVRRSCFRVIFHVSFSIISSLSSEYLTFSCSLLFPLSLSLSNRFRHSLFLA